MIVDRCDECGNTRPHCSSMNDWLKVTSYGEIDVSPPIWNGELHFCSLNCLKKWAVSN